VIARLIELGMDVHRSSGVTRTVLGVVGANKIDPGLIGILEGVHEVLRISEPYKLASRTFKPEDTVVSVGDVRIGGDEVVVMAGPCSAETDAQVEAAAAAVKRAGAKILRGGAFKPRSSPYSFQGLGEPGLVMLRDAADRHDLKLISEVMDISQIELIGIADIFRVGARHRTSRCSTRAGRVPGVLLKARHPARSRVAHPRRISSPAAIGATSTCARAASAPSNRHPQYVRHLSDSGRKADARRRRQPARCRRGIVARWRGRSAAGMDGLIIEVPPRPEQLRRAHRCSSQFGRSGETHHRSGDCTSITSLPSPAWIGGGGPMTDGSLRFTGSRCRHRPDQRSMRASVRPVASRQVINIAVGSAAHTTNARIDRTASISTGRWPMILAAVRQNAATGRTAGACSTPRSSPTSAHQTRHHHRARLRLQRPLISRHPIRN
jgi:hypothetical protein